MAQIANVQVRVAVQEYARLKRLVENMRPVFAAIAIEVWKEVGLNFEAQGIWARWAPLKESTKFARRAGQSSMALQASGQLKASFRPEWGKSFARVGSPLKIALFHHEGRTGPWIIKPRTKKALSFPWRGGKKVPRGGFKSYGNLKRSKGYQGKNFLTVRSVKHPGYPARPLLPTPERGAQIAAAVFQEFFDGFRAPGGGGYT